MIREITNKPSVILLQNAFPTSEKYIDYPHTINGKPLKVIDALKEEIRYFQIFISIKNSM